MTSSRILVPLKARETKLRSIRNNKIHPRILQRKRRVLALQSLDPQWKECRLQSKVDILLRSRELDLNHISMDPFPCQLLVQTKQDRCCPSQSVTKHKKSKKEALNGYHMCG